jgi:hypothetical protein
MADGLKPNDTFRPFSNGSEWMYWLESNCARGEKGCRNYRPDATSSRDGCPIEVAFALGSAGDGEVKAKHGLRGGRLAPGPGGLLIRADDATAWRCPEFRGYDEPDDRPRRGPRPPAGQIDLLDPRSAPERVPAVRP